MTPRKKRLYLVIGGVAIVGAAVALVLRAFNSNMVFFYTPTQVANHEVPQDRTFRIGGMVREGSLQREGVRVSFVVTDTATLSVLVCGVRLPALPPLMTTSGAPTPGVVEVWHPTAR